ncbi:hypothetical protein tinsulaeT_24870 [Thalassotalea insulae]|uniref:Transglutaminase domain-containing protein n=1 Tax=Thalassotalea insulae TaxID=2056778 RepID=A0ABQ6GUX3_9GAMM|nr:hypothetical protein [Thalassotalea insulae]GLX79147.1 hypothetical protein tinsulaeT_24870 [Thalassotalea insulae]
MLKTNGWQIQYLAPFTIVSKAGFILLMLLFTITTTSAKQSQFSKVLAGENYLFNYQWLDINQQQQTLSFSIPQKALFERYREFASYQPKLANEYISNALRKRLKKEPITGVQLLFKKEDEQLRIDINSKDPQLVKQAYQRIAKLKQSLTNDYLTKVYYQEFTTPNQIPAIKPDHARIALESVADFKTLKPVILEKFSVKNIRNVTNYILSFVQSIPYSPLASRMTSSGAGFNPPLKLLWENQGDCDSKVTLTASLLRTLMPRIKMALVFIDNHALIGINITPRGDEYTIEHQGLTYVLAEPTGPGLLTLGEIAPKSAQAIYSGYYTLEPFHNQFQESDDEAEEIPDF